MLVASADPAPLPLDDKAASGGGGGGGGTLPSEVELPEDDAVLLDVGKSAESFDEPELDEA